MINHVIRLDLLQSTLGTLLANATEATVAWTYGEPSFDDLAGGDLVSLRMLSGPAPDSQSAARGIGFLPPSSITIAITATVGKLARVVVNRIPYEHEIETGESVTDVREALIAAVNEDPEAAFAATSSGANLLLTPTALGGIWQASITGPLVASVAYADDLVLLTRSRRRCAVTITCYSKTTTVRAGAWRLASLCLAALEDPDNALALRDATVGVYSIGTPFDLSAIAGTRWESRVAFDVEMNIEAITIKPVAQIGDITGSITASPYTATPFTVETTV